MPRRAFHDRWLFTATLALVLAGLVMVASSSNYVGIDSGMASLFYLKQAIHVAIGLVAFFVAMTFRYQRLADQRLVVAGFLGFTTLMLITLAMPGAGGASRWISLGPLRLQPSEFAKIYVIVFVAYVLARRGEHIADPKRVLLPVGLVVGSLIFLTALEDLGSAVVMAFAAAVLLFVAGMRWQHVAVAAGAGGVAFTIGALAKPYRVQRILTFLNPDADPLGAGFQLKQSLIAFGNGGVTGMGLTHGQQKAYFIFGSHTDFIYSVIGEELGLIGTLGFLAMFLFVLWRGLRAARHAPDRFGCFLAMGLTSMLVGQALINMSVCLGLLPTKGLPLPFVSYGGSSLLASMAAMGLLLNVSQHAN